MILEKKVCPLGAQNGRTPFLTKKAWPRLDYECKMMMMMTMVTVAEGTK